MMRRQIQLDRPLLAAVFIVALGMIQFFYFVPMAMKCYPGGTIFEKHSQGYSWSKNWLSDLGRTQAWNGASNKVSARMFNGAVIGFGLSLATFFVLSLRASEEMNLASSISSVAGTVSACGLVGIGMTPFDKSHTLHIACLMLWILPMLIVACTFSFLSVRSGGWSAVIIPISSLVLIGSVVLYAFSSATSHVMLFQKIVVLLSTLWLAILACRVGFAAIFILVKTRSRLQIVNAQADKYTRQIEKRGLRRKSGRPSD